MGAEGIVIVQLAWFPTSDRKHSELPSYFRNLVSTIITVSGHAFAQIHTNRVHPATQPQKSSKSQQNKGVGDPNGNLTSVRGLLILDTRLMIYISSTVRSSLQTSATRIGRPASQMRYSWNKWILQCPTSNSLDLVRTKYWCWSLMFLLEPSNELIPTFLGNQKPVCRHQHWWSEGTHT